MAIGAIMKILQLLKGAKEITGKGGSSGGGQKQQAAPLPRRE